MGMHEDHERRARGNKCGVLSDSDSEVEMTGERVEERKKWS